MTPQTSRSTRWRLPLSLLLGGLAPLAIALTQPAMAEPKGELIVAAPSEPESMTPRKDACSFAAHWVADNVYERLTHREADGSISGWLAESFERVDDLTWRFKLRQGIKFTNGEPFNADAVVANVQYQLDPAIPSLCTDDFNALSGATKVDDYTVEIKTSRPDPIVPTDFGLNFLIAAPKWLAEKTDAQTAVEAVGTGPYIMTEWIKGTSLTLKANNDYWGDPKPTIETITFIPRGESQVRADMVKTGEADIALNISSINAATLTKTVIEPTTESVMIRLDTENPILKDIRVRQAINLAIDRTKIRDALFPGTSYELGGTIARPGAVGYDPDIKAYPYDPAEAKRLVAEAGATGATLDFVIRNDLLPNVSELAEVVQAMIQDTGLKVDIVPQDVTVWRQSLVARKPGQKRNALLITSSKNRQLDASRQLELYFGNGLASYAGGDAFAAKTAAVGALTGQQRWDEYKKLWREVHDQNWVVPLFGINYLHGVSDRVEWTPRGDGYAFFHSTLKLTD